MFAGILKSEGYKMNLVLAIIHYNENQYLDKLFSTISKSSLLPNKIVFIDNNSDINPINIIKKYDNLNIEYIRNDKNLLFTRGMNIAIRLAMKSNADVIGIMNSDMYVQNNTFEEIIKHINGPNIVAVTPNIRNIINTKDIFCPIKYTGIFKKSSYPQSNDLICETDFAIGASLFVKKDILEKTGLFYEPYLHGTDDFEMCDKLRKYGKILYIKTTNIYHRDSNERKDAPSKKNEFFEKLQLNK